MKDAAAGIRHLESVAEAMKRSGGNPEAACRMLAEQAAAEQPTPRTKPRNRTRTAAGKLQAERKRSMKSRALELLNEPATALALERFAFQYPAVVCIPGETAELHEAAGPNRRPGTALRRQPDGSILAKGSGHTGHQLPQPGQSESRYRSRHPHGWSTADAATMLRAAALRRLPQFRELPIEDIAADPRFDAAFPRAYQPEFINRRWLDAVRSMVNPEIWRICRQAARDSQEERTGLSRYNLAARNASALSRLLETNPGAAAWFMTIPRPEPETAANHPGQIIAAVRDEFRQAGGRRWKSMAAMNPAEAAIIVNSGSRNYFGFPENPRHPFSDPARRLAAYAGMRHAAGGPPDSEIINQDVADALQDASDGSGFLRMGQALSRLANGLDSTDDLIKCLTLFIKESRRPDAPLEEELRRQTFQVADYLLAPGGVRPIAAASWRGLVRNAGRWHRRIIEENNERERLKSLLRNSGLYRKWRSALPAANLPGGFIAVPADDEGALSELGRAMNHCAGSYAERCLSHKTRIYQVHREGEAPASGVTCELSAGEDEWQAVQISGKGNRAPDGPESEACRELAAMYGKAYRTMGRNSHDQSGVKVPDPEDPAYRKYLELAKNGELDKAAKTMTSF